MNIQASSSNIVFDTLAYAKRLKLVGFTEEQAEVQAEAIANIVNEKLATKYDLKELDTKAQTERELIRRDIKELEIKLEQEIKKLDTKAQTERELIKQEIKELDIKAQTERELIRRDIKELEISAKKDRALLKRDLKIWFGSVLTVAVIVLAALITFTQHAYK